MKMKNFEHGGNVHRLLREQNQEGVSTNRVYDFSANINPFGAPEWLRPLLSRNVDSLLHYPDPDYSEFTDTISKFTGRDPQNIVVGNGTSELLYAFMRVLPASRIVLPVPSYVDYLRAAEAAGKTVETVPCSEENDFRLDLQMLSGLCTGGDLVVLASPNNPTGHSLNREELLHFIEEREDVHFLLDEAFLEFVEGGKSLGAQYPHVSSLNSMTKFYGIPGLRLGYGLFPGAIAQAMTKVMPPWSLNTFAAEVGNRCLQDTDFQNKSRLLVNELREEFIEGLSRFPQLKVYPSQANYLFIKLQKNDTTSLSDFCLKKNLLIRRCDNYQGLTRPEIFFRIAVRTREENQYLLKVFADFFKIKRESKSSGKTTRTIMFQGTCSDAGKSIVTAAFCRIFLQDGHKVAPFKSQNMSLNSFVTLQGGEMGRAQVVQAQAAKLDPDCRMNPILLKPNSDTGSQIIVDGQPVGNMSVLEYNAYKPHVWQSVCNSFDSLADENDIIVLEGAGSPGEVNLKAHDIVNMKMAQYAGAPVILVGDIDRGGVYASFVGTLEVLSRWERDLLAGFLVNKFRGQASLLESAHDYVLNHTGKPVFGVIPYLAHLGLPEEDSVSFKKGSFIRTRAGEGVDIVLVNLPHISNFTDVEPFLEEPDVSVRIAKVGTEIGNPDAVILPGSKNVISDLRYLRENGFEQPLAQCLARGVEIVGICGGYQMLGKKIKDPHHIESTALEIDGLGFLQMDTVIELQKQLYRKSGVHTISGEPVSGYEIHHGITSVQSKPALEFSDGSICGSYSDSGLVWGSYLHGIFDSDEFRRWFIDGLRQRKDLEPLGKIAFSYDLEHAFDRLAKCVRESVNMDQIYQLLNL